MTAKPHLYILGECGEQNPYHFLFCMIPQFRDFDDGVSAVYYKYPYTHPQNFRDGGLKALPPRFQKQYDLSGFEVSSGLKEFVAGIPGIWVYQYTRNLYSHIWSDCKPFRCIYISRKFATCRRVINENDLESGLLARNIQIVNLESYTFEESIRLAAESYCIIGPHGAGLSFSAFCPTNSFLLEINTPGMCESHFSSLAAECSLKYKRFMGVEKKDGDYFVDTDSFFSELDDVLTFLRYHPHQSQPPEPQTHGQGASGSSSTPP